MHSGMRVAINVTRRSAGYARPTGGNRLQRLLAPLLALPLLVLALAAAIVLLVLFFVAGLFLAATFTIAAIVVRRRLSRAP
jgi:hypothetical protein